MVSAFTTAMRNAETQTVRSVTERITDAVEMTFRGMFGLGTDLTPGDIARSATRLARVSKAAGWDYGYSHSRLLAEQILAWHPEEVSKLFSTYSGADIPGLNTALAGRSLPRRITSSLLNRAEHAAFFVNHFNRIQEFHVRSAEFLAELDRYVRRDNGSSLEDFLKRKGSGQLDPKHIQQAIDKALEVTFAANPPRDTYSGKVLNAMITVGNAIPPTISPAAFPRFMYNNLKFLYEYSPAGGIDVFRSAVKGESISRPFARMLVGTGMLAIASGVRSQFGGEKWYEIKIPGSKKLLDARPFGPFSTYLFLAEAGKRLLRGESMTLREWGEALGSTSSVTGLSQAAIERIWGYWDRGNVDEAQSQLIEAVKQETGEAGRSLLTPVHQFKDAIAQFSKYEATSRDTGDAPTIGPMLESIPFASRAYGLPEAHQATTGTPIHQEQPLLKAVLGPRVETQKTYIQQELDRLRFQPPDIRSYTGIKRLDRAVTNELGPLLDAQAPKFQSDPRYQRAGDKVRKLLLHDMLQEARAEALDKALKDNPDLTDQYLQRGQSRWQKLEEEVGNQRNAPPPQ
jgi:hypothetical protein